MSVVASRLSRLAALASQTANVILFNGSADETISGRAWREGELGGDPVWHRRRLLIDRLFWTLLRQPDHCRGSHRRDVEFALLILGRHR